jgi:hypothetical protein
MALSTIGTAGIADDAITAAKIDDDGAGFVFGDVTTGALTATGATTGIVTFDKLKLDGSSVATVTVNSAVSASATIVVDGVSGTIAVGMVVNVSDTTVRSITDAASQSAISVDDTLTITAVASQTSFTVSEAVSIADDVVLILRADESSKMVLDASAASTDVGDEILFEDATGDVNTVLNSNNTGVGGTINFLNTTTNTGVTTFNSAPVFSAGGAGGLVKLAQTDISDNTASIIFDNVVTSSHDNYLLIGTMSLSAGENARLTLEARQGGASGSTVTSGETANRAAAAAYQGYARNGASNNILFPFGLLIYGGATFNFRMSFGNFHTGVVAETTNISTRRNFQGEYTCDFQSTNASDAHGFRGWWKADTASTDAFLITGIKLSPNAGAFNGGSLALYGYAK